MQRRVLVVTDSTHKGCGVREVVLVLLRALKRAGWDVSFAGAGYKPEEDAPEFKEIRVAWFKSICISKVGMNVTLFFLPWVFARIVWEVIRAELIIVESNSTAGMTTIVVAKLYNLIAKCLFLKRKKILFHAHTQADEYIKNIALFDVLLGRSRIWSVRKFVKVADWYLSRFLCWVANSGIRGFMNCCDHSIVPTDFFAGMIEKRYRGRFFKLRVQPEAWSSPLSIPASIKKYSIEELYNRKGKHTRKIPSNCLLLVYIGRIGREKGTEKLLEFFGELRLLGLNVGLVIIGGGDVAKYRRLADALPEDAGRYVSLFGRVSHDESLALNDAGEDDDKERVVAVTYSGTETQAIAVDEQGHFGHAVVALIDTCIAVKIAICNGGFLLSGDVEKSARLFAEFLRDPVKRRECGRNMKHYIRELLDEKKCMNRIVQICTRVCEGRYR